MKNIQDTDGKFKKEQRAKIKYFLNLCKYDLVPSTFGGGITSIFLVDIYNSSGIYDAFLFGGVSSLALTLAINATITGIKMKKEEREKIIEEIENSESFRKGKHL